METNLRDGMANAYWRVTAPFEVLALAGWSESNTWFGSAQALGAVYRRLTLAPGDEVHALVGGTFAVTGAGVVQVRISISEKHPFEKTYLPQREDWPLKSLAPLTAETRRQTSYDALAGLKRIAPGQPVGRSIDSILPPPHVGEEGES